MEKMDKVVLNVEGMSCGHCVNAVTQALSSLEVQNVDVSLENKTVTVVYDDSKITVDQMKQAIEEQGFEVK